MAEAQQNSIISQAIANVYAKASLEESAVKGIVPLFELIDSFPLTVIELETLTYRSATEYLRQATGRQLPLPQNEDCKLAGYLFATRYQGHLWGYIFLNKGDPLTRRRFSAAHELGHYVLHFLPWLTQTSSDYQNLMLAEGIESTSNEDEENSVGQITLSSPDEQGEIKMTKNSVDVEREADTFAAELLMPRAVCRQLVATISRQIASKKEVLEKRLAAELMVSRMAIANRFRDLKLLESSLSEPPSAVVRSN